MKNLLKTAAVAMTLAGTATLLHAQSPSIVYGRTTLQLASQLTSGASGLGVTITDLNGNTLQNSELTLTATTGALDLTNSAGEVELTGGLIISAGSLGSVRVQDIVVDTTTPNVPEITGLFVYNGHVEGRLPLFNFSAVPPSYLPLVPTNGVVQFTNVPMTLAAAFTSAVNNVLGSNLLQANAPIGDVSLYLVLSPTN